MGFFDRFRTPKLGVADSAPMPEPAYAPPAIELPPVKTVAPTPVQLRSVEPIDIGAWTDRYTPSAMMLPDLGAAGPAQSYANISVPAGYELVRSDQVGSGRLDMPPVEAPTDEPKALYWDPFSLVEQLGFRDKPSAITYATLNAMTWRVPIIQAIIQTRMNQVSSFCTPQVHKFETGFRVKMRDKEARPTKSDKKFAKRMEEMIMQSGVVSRDPRGRDSFDSFMRKITRDSLIYDQLNFEVVPGRDGRPAEWYHVDASTIRLANSRVLYPDDDMDRVHTVQIYDNVTISEFTREEMAFECRNPRTDIRGFGYGTSELEMLVTTVTAILWAWQYNQNAFAQGSLQKGILNIVGAIPENQLRSFKRQWYTQVAGIENAWRTPITNAEELQWINMQNSSKDMEFSAWMDFLIKVACAIYQMDPIEVNFKYGTTNQRSMFEGANKSKLVESKDKGLKPLLRFLARCIDKYIIWPINPNFTFEFVGLEAQTPKEMADLMTQRVRTIYTIDEVRAEQDLEPLPDGKGAVILDANWMNAAKLIDQKKEAKEAKDQAEAETEAQAAALAAMPDSKVSQEEMANLAQLLSHPDGMMGAGAAAANAPPIGNSGGPGGGKVAPDAPPASSPIAKSVVIDVEI